MTDYILAGTSKKKLQLSNQLGKGGEAEVFSIVDKSPLGKEIVLKKYLPQANDRYFSKNSSLQKKIEYMVHNIDFLGKYDELCWPLLNAYDAKNHNWIGYCMYKAKGIALSSLIHPHKFKKNFSNLNRKDILKYLINFLFIIDILHKNKIYIGDYNIENFLIDENSDRIIFIDTDSYQTNYFPSPVISTNMSPVEVWNNKRNYTLESENFSVAVFLFMVLMCGQHPYSQIGGGSPEENIKNGNFAYKTGKNIPKIAYCKEMWNFLPDDVKNLFIKTFSDGANKPNERVSINVWSEALKNYLKSLCSSHHKYEVEYYPF